MGKTSKSYAARRKKELPRPSASGGRGSACTSSSKTNWTSSKARTESQYQRRVLLLKERHGPAGRVQHAGPAKRATRGEAGSLRAIKRCRGNEIAGGATTSHH